MRRGECNDAGVGVPDLPLAAVGEPHLRDLDPLQVSLLAAATNLPLFLFGIPAGGFADVFGPWKILLGAQIWMVAFAMATVFMLQGGMLGPSMMIVPTFVLS